MTRPIQNAEKLPATRPDRTLSDAPPWSEASVISWTCRDLVLTKIFVNSMMSAPASVPQPMMAESTHQRFGSGTSVEHAVDGLRNREIAEQQLARAEADEDGNDAGDPDQVGERRFPVEIFVAAVTEFGDGHVEIKRAERRQHHQRLDGKHPDDELGAQQRRQRQRQREKRDERHAGHAVGFKAVRRRADASRRRCRRCSRR